MIEDIESVLMLMGYKKGRSLRLRKFGNEDVCQVHIHKQERVYFIVEQNSLNGFYIFDTNNILNESFVHENLDLVISKFKDVIHLL